MSVTTCDNFCTFMFSIWMTVYKFCTIWTAVGELMLWDLNESILKKWYGSYDVHASSVIFNTSLS